MQIKTILFPRRMCETIAGDFAYIIGRVACRPGRPMLVEHDLTGTVLTRGYGREYDIAHVHADVGLPVCKKECTYADHQGSAG